MTTRRRDILVAHASFGPAGKRPTMAALQIAQAWLKEL
jgi:hypothetical protein